MKRFLSILIAIYYLAGTAGISMNLHYCAGEIESLSLGTEADYCCCAKFEKVENCCGDKQIVFELADEEEQIVNSFSFSPIVILEKKSELLLPIIKSDEAIFWNNSLPFLIPKSPLWLLFQSPLDYA